MKKNNPNPYKENILWILTAIIAGFATEALVMVIGRTVPLGELVRNVFSYISIGRIIFFEIIYLSALGCIYIANRKGIDWLDKIYKFRYYIALRNTNYLFNFSNQWFFYGMLGWSYRL